MVLLTSEAGTEGVTPTKPVQFLPIQKILNLSKSTVLDAFGRPSLPISLQWSTYKLCVELRRFRQKTESHRLPIGMAFETMIIWTSWLDEL